RRVWQRRRTKSNRRRIDSVAGGENSTRCRVAASDHQISIGSGPGYRSIVKDAAVLAEHELIAGSYIHCLIPRRGGGAAEQERVDGGDSGRGGNRSSSDGNPDIGRGIVGDGAAPRDVGVSVVGDHVAAGIERGPIVGKDRPTSQNAVQTSISAETSG